VQLLYTGWGNSARLHKLVSGGRDGVRVWSVPEYTCQLHIPVEKGVTCVDMDPCTVVVSSFDKSIRVYDFDHRDDVVL
jgi:WD40 repeat protein